MSENARCSSGRLPKRPRSSRSRRKKLKRKLTQSLRQNPPMQSRPTCRPRPPAFPPTRAVMRRRRARRRPSGSCLPSPVQPINPAVAPVAVTPNPAPPVEAAVAPEERRDANDLARAAIERLRGNSDNAPACAAGRPYAGCTASARGRGRSRYPACRVRAGATAAAAADHGLDAAEPGRRRARSGIAAEAALCECRSGDPRRPTPPADIPVARPPLDLRAEAAEPMPQGAHQRRRRHAVGGEVGVPRRPAEIIQESLS